MPAQHVTLPQAIAPLNWTVDGDGEQHQQVDEWWIAQRTRSETGRYSSGWC